MSGSEMVIATRRYYTAPEGEGEEILLSIERPFQDESGYFRCVYRFTGAVQRDRWAAGVDELSALIYALSMAGTELQGFDDEKFGKKLIWDAGPASGSLPTVSDNWPFNKSG